jgi:hypothetical protein
LFTLTDAGHGISSAIKTTDSGHPATPSASGDSKEQAASPVVVDPETEKKILLALCDFELEIPSDASAIANHTQKMLGYKVDLWAVEALLKKFADQSLIR